MHKLKLNVVKGGVTAALGFSCAGVKAGIKEADVEDLGIVFSQTSCSAAGTFTTNSVRAACVNWTESLVPSNTIRAIVCNSGNANACTGNKGVADVKTMAGITARSLGINTQDVLVASTGIIGKYLPMEKMKEAIPRCAKSVSSSSGAAFAKAIMTTDTIAKEYAVEFIAGNSAIRIGGTCKGAGMIHPNMATMLGFITTDANISPARLSTIVKRVVDRTFNMVTVDGDTSTNDMVVVLANGESGICVRTRDELAAFETGLHDVCDHLCRMIAADGEGATKCVSIQVKGAKSEKEAACAARTIAESNLVKTAMFGNDPNWGRILCAIGYSGVSFDPKGIRVAIAGTTVCRNLRPAPFNQAKVSKALNAKQVQVDVDLAVGNAEATAHTCDFSYDYVKINAEYHT